MKTVRGEARRDGNTEGGAENSVKDKLFSISPGSAVDVHLARQTILEGFSSDLSAGINKDQLCCFSQQRLLT